MISLTVLWLQLYYLWCTLMYSYYSAFAEKGMIEDSIHIQESSGFISIFWWDSSTVKSAFIPDCLLETSSLAWDLPSSVSDSTQGSCTTLLSFTGDDALATSWLGCKLPSSVSCNKLVDCSMLNIDMIGNCRLLEAQMIWIMEVVYMG